MNVAYAAQLIGPRTANAIVDGTSVRTVHQQLVALWRSRLDDQRRTLYLHALTPRGKVLVFGGLNGQQYRAPHRAMFVSRCCVWRRRTGGLLGDRRRSSRSRGGRWQRRVAPLWQSSVNSSGAPPGAGTTTAGGGEAASTSFWAVACSPAGCPDDVWTHHRAERRVRNKETCPPLNSVNFYFCWDGGYNSGGGGCSSSWRWLRCVRRVCIFLLINVLGLYKFRAVY